MKTIFFKPTHPTAARYISIESVPKANESIRWLTREWNDAKTRPKKRRLIKYASLAAGRCTASAKKKSLSGKERREFRLIGSIYKKWLRRHRLT